MSEYVQKRLLYVIYDVYDLVMVCISRYPLVVRVYLGSWRYKLSEYTYIQTNAKIGHLPWPLLATIY